MHSIVFQKLKNPVVVEGLWMGIERISTLLLSLASGVLVARHLGPAGSGALAYAFGIQTLLLPFITFALEPVIVRELSSGAERGKLLNAYWTFTTISSSIAGIFLLVLALCQPWASNEQIALLCVALTLPFAKIALIEWLFRSDRTQRKLSRLHVLKEVFINLAKTAFAFFKATFIAFTSLIVVQAIATYFINVRQAKSNYDSLPQWSITDLKQCKKIFKEGTPLLLSAICTAIFSRIDLVMIEHQIGITEVGYYSSATRIIEIFILLPAFVNQLMTPSYARWMISDPDKFRRNSCRIEIISVLSAVFISLLLLKTGHVLLPLLFGVKFIAAAPILKTLALSLPPIFALSLLANKLVVRGKSKEVLISFSIGAALNVLLNWLWIPDQGSIGAASATVYSMSIASIIIFLFEVRQRKY